MSLTIDRPADLAEVAFGDTDLTPRDLTGRKLSIVAPAYNEEEVLPLFFRRLEPLLESCVPDYEIICINDGSRDRTLAVLLAERRRNPRVKIVNLSRNFGKETALSAGLEFASGDMVVPIDVDLQDPPELIVQFIARWVEGYDVVYGARQSRHGDTAMKRLTAGAFYKVFGAVSDVPLAPDAGDFRLMDREVVEVLKSLPERNRFMKGLFAWVGFRQIGVPYQRPARAAGVTSWRYWKLWNFALDGLTSFTTLPLKIWSYIGAFVAGCAALYAVGLVAYTMIHGKDVRGWASLMVVLLISLGAQMLAFGILGEYIGRIYQEVKGRPLFVVQRKYGFD